MFKKKSFQVNKDENKLKTTERLYQPKKFRWCKYIVLPLLVGFILLLILTNVDFNGNAYNQSPSSWNETNARIYSIDNTAKETLRHINSFIARIVNCIPSTDSCSLICIGGNVNNVYKQLEALYKSCQRDMDLILIDCQIPSGRLKSDFFAGNYRLKSLNITNCNLNSIQHKAFQQEAVKNLLNLTLIKTQFVDLDESSFEGLTQLEQFVMLNTESGTKFKGEGFLKHFSETLLALDIQQESSSSNTYDPFKWLQGNAMKSLKNVSLANNNFGGFVQQTTFSNLVCVEYLNLANSGLSYLPSNAFDKIVKTLKYLNLSYNKLSTLDGEMLLQMPDMQLDLSFNRWHCSCDNKEMLQIIQWNLIEIEYLRRTNLRCYTPIEQRDMLLDEVQLDCLIRTTVIAGETTTPSEETAETVVITTTIRVTKQTTTLSSNTTSNSGSSSSSSSSSETSESSSSSSSESSLETETIDTTPTTAMTTTTTTVTSTTTTTTSLPETTATSKVATTQTSFTLPPPLQHPRIYCHTNANVGFSNPMIAKKWEFSIKPLTATAIKIQIEKVFNQPGIVYFTKDHKGTVVVEASSVETQQQQQPNNEFLVIIKDLNPNASYVFCLLEQLKGYKADYDYVWNISPLDCFSYSRPVTVAQAWLVVEDQVWLISLVVLGTCLMLLLGIILILVCLRRRKRHFNKLHGRLNNDLEINSSNFPQTPSTSHRSYSSRLQPPDVVAQHPNCNCNHDIYEELIM